MLLEFVTSPAGHLMNTGFQIKAETIFESVDSKAIEVCVSLFNSLFECPSLREVTDVCNEMTESS